MTRKVVKYTHEEKNKEIWCTVYSTTAQMFAYPLQNLQNVIFMYLFIFQNKSHCKICMLFLI